MKFLASLLFGIVLLNYSEAQEKANVPEKHLSLTIGKSKHGSGDLDGVMISIGYSKKLSKHFSWHAGLTSTLHDGKFPVIYTIPGTNNTIDGSYRYTTGGFQGSFLIGHDFLKTIKHRLDLRLGGILRYQSSSYYDVITVFYPPSTGLLVPVIVLENTTPQRTFAVGAIGEVFYGYQISPKLMLGASAGLQIDSNGDTMRQLGISVCSLLN